MKNMKKTISLFLTLFVLLTLMPIRAVLADSSTQENKEMLYPAYVHENGIIKWGLIDKNGTFVVKPVYDAINEFWDNGLAIIAVSKYKDGVYKNYFGLINRQGKLVAEPDYTYISLLGDGMMLLRVNDSKSYVMDNAGKVLFETQYNIFQFRDGMAKYYIRNGNASDYGYLNIKGEIAVPPQYKFAGEFNNGMAIVITKEDEREVIDKTGQVLYHLDFSNAVNLSEGVFTFSQTDTVQGRPITKKGYAALDGTNITEAKYISAEPFKEGFAVVATDFTYPGGEGHYGLINKKGEFVISPDYSDIKPKGKGYFAVGRGGFSTSSDLFSKKALFNSDGKQITDFLYYTIGDLEDGYFPVCDGKRVFYIDTEGNEADDYPKAQGIGIFKNMGELIQGKFDTEIMYYSKQGKVVYKPQETWRYKTEQGIEIYEKKYKPDINTLIRYPEIKNLPDSNVQGLINRELKNIFVDKNEETLKKDSQSQFTANFSAELNKDLLIIKYDSYNYSYGAAHGMPAKEYYLFNIKNGNTYKLSDLFTKDSNYIDRLSELIKEKIRQKKADKNSMILINQFEGFKKEPKFTLTKDALQIYFYPYEIAAYAAGFPSFDILYTDLADILDFDGGLWNSFERNYQVIPESQEQAKEKAEREVLKSLEAYEKNMIEAINNKDFSNISPYLLKDSNLYQSQMSLVDYLGGLEIRENNEDYKLQLIEWEDEFNSCKIYVYEKTNIKYSDDTEETKEFYWIYTAQYVPDAQRYQLSDIEIWNRE